VSPDADISSCYSWSSVKSLSRRVTAFVTSVSHFRLTLVWVITFRRVLDDNAMKTLVHAFSTSRLYYCNAVLAGSPKSTTDTLQRVLNAAARLVTNTDKYDRGLLSLLHEPLHWLNVPERIYVGLHKLAVTVRRCLENEARTYWSDHCIPVTVVSSRHLRSANQHQLTVPRCRRITFGHWAFSVADPMVWNSPPTEFRDLSVGYGVLRRTLKTILFARY